MTRLAEASGYEVIVRAPDDDVSQVARMIDPFTAIALLHHDLDQETLVLAAALGTSPFYIGALGSSRTHRKRVQRLEELGYHKDSIGRIKAPIGVFGPARDSTSLALSVLADIAASSLSAYG